MKKERIKSFKSQAKIFSQLNHIGNVTYIKLKAAIYSLRMLAWIPQICENSFLLVPVPELNALFKVIDRRVKRNRKETERVITWKAVVYRHVTVVIIPQVARAAEPVPPFAVGFIVRRYRGQEGNR